MSWLLIFAAVLVGMELIAFLIRRDSVWPVEYPKETLGCSHFPEGNWFLCCIFHDKAYREGGTPWDRLVADARFFWCCLLKDPIVALGGFAAIRTVGMWAFKYGPKRVVIYRVIRSAVHGQTRVIWE